MPEDLIFVVFAIRNQILVPFVFLSFVLVWSSSSCCVGLLNVFFNSDKKVCGCFSHIFTHVVTGREYVTKLDKENESKIFHIKADNLSKIAE